MTSRRFALAALIPGFPALAIVLILRAELAYPGLSFLDGRTFITLNQASLICMSLTFGLTEAGAAHRAGLPAHLAWVFAIFTTLLAAKIGLSSSIGSAFLPLWYLHALGGSPVYWMIASWVFLVLFLAILAWKLPVSRISLTMSSLALFAQLTHSARISAPIDALIHVTDTYFAIAPIVAFCAIALPILWLTAAAPSIPKYAETTIATLFTLSGIISFRVYTILGNQGMPRDYPDYPAHFASRQFLASLILFAIALLMIITITTALLRPSKPSDIAAPFR